MPFIITWLPLIPAVLVGVVLGGALGWALGENA